MPTVERADHRFVVDLGQRRRARAAVRVAGGRASVSRSCSDAGADPRRNRGVARSGPARGPLVAVPARSTAQAAAHGQRDLPAEAGTDPSSRRAPARRVDGRSHRWPAPDHADAASREANEVRPARHRRQPEVEDIDDTASGARAAASPRARVPAASTARPGRPANSAGRTRCGSSRTAARRAAGCAERSRTRTGCCRAPWSRFVERDNLPWTLAVVRRLRKRIGDRVDIGVEYVGQNPLGVTLVAEGDHAGRPTAAPDKEAQALHLRSIFGRAPSIRRCRSRR